MQKELKKKQELEKAKLEEEKRKVSVMLCYLSLSKHIITIQYIFQTIIYYFRRKLVELKNKKKRKKQKGKN